MTAPGTDNSVPTEEMIPVDVYDEAGNKIQIMTTRQQYEMAERAREIAERIKNGPIVWASEEERLQAMSWDSDNDEDSMIKEGCVRRKDD